MTNSYNFPSLSIVVHISPNYIFRFDPKPPGFVTLTEAAVIFLWTSFLRASGSRHDIPFCLCLFSEFSECVSGDEVASVIEEIVDLTMS